MFIIFLTYNCLYIVDAPIMMSFPHFLYAEKSVLEPFEGLHPDPEKHEFFIDIQRVYI